MIYAVAVKLGKLVDRPLVKFVAALIAIAATTYGATHANPAPPVVIHAPAQVTP